jgi:hypothetical protein
MPSIENLWRSMHILQMGITDFSILVPLEHSVDRFRKLGRAALVDTKSVYTADKLRAINAMFDWYSSQLV